MFNKLILSLATRTLQSMITHLTPRLLDWLRTIAVEFKERATATDNPWDDMIADFIITIVRGK